MVRTLIVVLFLGTAAAMRQEHDFELLDNDTLRSTKYHTHAAEQGDSVKPTYAIVYPDRNAIYPARAPYDLTDECNPQISDQCYELTVIDGTVMDGAPPLPLNKVSTVVLFNKMTYGIGPSANSVGQKLTWGGHITREWEYDLNKKFRVTIIQQGTAKKETYKMTTTPLVWPLKPLAVSSSILEKLGIRPEANIKFEFDYKFAYSNGFQVAVQNPSAADTLTFDLIAENSTARADLLEQCKAVKNNFNGNYQKLKICDDKTIYVTVLSGENQQGDDDVYVRVWDKDASYGWSSETDGRFQDPKTTPQDGSPVIWSDGRQPLYNQHINTGYGLTFEVKRKKFFGKDPVLGRVNVSMKTFTFPVDEVSLTVPGFGFLKVKVEFVSRRYLAQGVRVGLPENFFPSTTLTIPFPGIGEFEFGAKWQRKRVIAEAECNMENGGPLPSSICTKATATGDFTMNFKSFGVVNMRLTRR